MRETDSSNGITTAADYQLLTEQTVTLPSGAVFLLRRPTLSYRLRNFGMYQSIAARAEAGGPLAATDGQTRELVQFYYQVLCEVCQRPRVSLDPQEAELHPEQIQLADALFIARWAGGEVSADGADLAKFRAGRPERSAAGPGGGNVELPPERAVGIVTGNAVSDPGAFTSNASTPQWPGQRIGDGSAD